MNDHRKPDSPFGPLFAASHARRTDPATSHGAAASVSSAESHCEMLLAAYRSALPGGLTDEEAAARCGIDPLREGGKRCADLRRLGLVAPTGEVRAGSSGRARMVCRAVSDVAA